MGRPESILAYTELVNAFKTSHAAVRTNCFLLPGEIERLIAAWRVRVYRDGENLLVFVDEAACERLYYYTASPEPLGEEALAELAGARGPVALNLVSRGAEDPTEAKWTRSGFVLRGVYQRMTVSAQSAAAWELPAGGGAPVQTRDEGRIPEILALWRQCLDPLEIERPDADRLRALMADHRVRFIVGEDGALCAVMVSVPAGRKAAIDHVAVHPAYRRQGLARALLTASMRLDVQGGAEAFTLWVNRENEAAIRLYRAFGFAPDGMQTRLFVWEQPG